MEKKYKVGGMMCAGCVAGVERALKALSGVETVSVDLATGIVTVVGNITAETVAEAVDSIGFDYLGEA